MWITLIDALLLALCVVAVPGVPLVALTRLRERKRRLTVGALMAWIGLLAVDFGAMVGSSGLPSKLLLPTLFLFTLYAAPLVAFALYVPHRCEVTVAVVVLVLVLLIVVLPLLNAPGPSY